MGNKSSPRALRLGISQLADVNWFAEPRLYAEVLSEDIKLRQYINQNFKSAIVSKVIINRVKDAVELCITCLKPSHIIGRQGENNIEAITKKISSMIKKDVKIKIFDIKKPELSATCVARDIANEINRKGASCRRIIKKYVQTSKRGGALGIRVQCSGRLAGAEIARTEWYQEGAVPRQKFRADIDYAEEKSYSSWGVSGVKVWIYKGDVIEKLKRSGE